MLQPRQTFLLLHFAHELRRDDPVDDPRGPEQTAYVEGCERHGYFFFALAARFLSSGFETFSLRVAIHHWLPALSCTPPERSP
jgi:hypothetical protein